MNEHERTAALIIVTIPEVRGGDLTRLRSELNLSVETMADILRVSRATVYRIEAADEELPPAECLLFHYLKGFFAGVTEQKP